YLCAYNGERLIGFANVAWDGRAHAFLLDPRVHPDLRHNRIGTQLVALAAEAAKTAGCTVLHVDFRDELAPFYFDACGFKPTLAEAEVGQQLDGPAARLLAAQAADHLRQDHILDGGEFRQQVVGLVDKADLKAADAGALRVGELRGRDPLDEDLAGVGVFEQA